MGSGDGGRRRLVARVVGSTVVGTIALLTFECMTTPEPWSTSFGLAVVGVLGVGAVITLVTVFLSIRAGTWILAALVPVVYLTGILSALSAERLHWRWSRADFVAISEGADVRCRPGTECRLGWWRVRGSERFEEMVVVWLAGDRGCYAGRGLAMPLNGDADADAVTASAQRIDGPTDLVIVSGWREGWYELCFIS